MSLKKFSFQSQLAGMEDLHEVQSAILADVGLNLLNLITARTTLLTGDVFKYNVLVN